jgi:GNAT superfamily N-acetyltransferase
VADGVRTGGGALLTPAQLAALLAVALPDEPLSAEELEATLFDDPDGIVLGDDDGAVGVAVRDGTGWITVVAVDPAAQRRGIGRSLLESAHAWLAGRGVAEVRTGAAAPRYLWPGVDVEAHGPAVALFESLGYSPVATTHNHRCPTSFRASPPDGVTVRRVTAADAAAAGGVVAFAAASFPQWVDELTRSLPNGCCHAAFDDADGTAIGFACHSVNRAAWIGPMATDDRWRGRGVGSALLGAVCRDLSRAELDEAEIAWVGPDAFYEKAAGATRSRRFVVLARHL